MKKVIKIFFISILILAIIFLIATFGFVSYIIKTQQNIEFDKNKILSATKETIIYDNKDTIAYYTSDTKIIPVSINNIKDETIDAFLSIEDKKFYNHNGLNYKRMAKALINNITQKSFVEGASTISQQLIKNTHLNNDKTISRKIKEIYLTKKLENSFTKDEILETYLNAIYFGNNSYGIEQASQNYFNKTTNNLTLSESATLAGLIKSPAKYSPITNMENCISRRNLVLNEMKKDNKITTKQFNEAINSKITISSRENKKDYLTDYINRVKFEACKLLNIESENLAGYKIYTYLDDGLQKNLFDKISNLDENSKNKNGFYPDALGTVIDINNYGISAFAGNSDYYITDFYRQPGSTIKPILVYAPALEEGLISPISPILDEKININGYSPNNVGNIFNGYVSVRDSIAKSLNIPAIKVMEMVGIEKCKNFANKCGVSFTNNDNGLALALGGFNKGMNLIDLTNTFIPFANNGFYKQSSTIKKILNNFGMPIYEDKSPASSVISSDTSYLMTDMLKSGVEYGTSKKLKKLNFDVAGKTGTVAISKSNLNSDAISVAYTTKHLMGVWLGNYTFETNKNLSSNNNGGTFATKIIYDTFDELYKQQKPMNFIKPNSIQTLKIDTLSLEEEHVVKIASDNLPERYIKKEIFSNKNIPNEKSTRADNIKIKNFKADLNDNDLFLNFTSDNIYLYKLFIYENNKLFKSEIISNFKGENKFSYNNLKYNNEYLIKLEVYDDINKLIETKQLILKTLNNKYEKLLNNFDNNSYLYY